MKLSNEQLTQIQQTFVRRFMTDERIVGVRVRRDGYEPVLVIEVDESAGLIELPTEFQGLRVDVKAGTKAVLAFAT